MLAIEKDGNKYKLKVSEPGTGWRGYSVFAENLTEVKTAVGHYFALPRQCRRPCPLCRKTEQEQAA